MRRAREYFSALPSSVVNWDGLMAKGTITKLDPNKHNLAEIFYKYFDGFFHCVESAKLNYDGFKSYPGYEYEPVRTVISDISKYFEDKNRPLADYDALGPTDTPFWLR